MFTKCSLATTFRPGFTCFIQWIHRLNYTCQKNDCMLFLTLIHNIILSFVLFTKTLSIIHHVAVINTQRIRNTVISTCCHFTSDDVLTTIMTPCVISRLQQYMWQFNSITSSHLGGGEMICLCRWQLDLRQIYIRPWMGLQYSASTRG